MKKTHPHAPPDPGKALRLIAWELTRSCNLSCRHCRASSERGPYPDELSTYDALQLLDDIAAFSSPIMILTGGEPLFREDILDIASHGTQLGLRMVLATNGTLLTRSLARELARVGIKRISVSIDGKNEISHDHLRGVPGAFTGALFGIENAKSEGLSFQINTTITRRNVDELEEISALASDLNAAAHHLFLLVPTGRGSEMAQDSLSAQEYERVLSDIYRYETTAAHQVKVTCAPQYMRIRKILAEQEGRSLPVGHHGGNGLSATTRGCLGGVAFLFISHCGDTQPCGYLEINGGNIRTTPIRDIWESSPVFTRLRDYSKLSGKCGQCEYTDICGGCRARAFAASGDYMGPEPLCPYVPASMSKKHA